MRPSRGMGAMSPKKLKAIKAPKKVVRRDALVPTKLYKKGGKIK